MADYSNLKYQDLAACHAYMQQNFPAAANNIALLPKYVYAAQNLFFLNANVSFYALDSVTANYLDAVGYFNIRFMLQNNAPGIDLTAGLGGSTPSFAGKTGRPIYIELYRHLAAGDRIQMDSLISFDAAAPNAGIGYFYVYFVYILTPENGLC